MTPPPEGREEGSALRATLLVVLSACCFGSVSPLTTIALRHGALLQGVQTLRYGTSALLLIALGVWMARRRATARTARPAAAGAAGVQRPWPDRPWWHPVVLALAGIPQAAVATFALLALRWIPAATASFLFYTFPAWVAVITALRGVEPLSRTRILALLLALAGIAAMVGAPDSASIHPLGAACALGAALLYAVYIPLLERLSVGRESIDIARAISVGGSVIFIVWSLATGALNDGFHPIAAFAGVLQGVLSTGAFLGFLAGLSRLGPVRAAITSTVEPFWTTLLGAVLLAQPVGMGTLVGGVLIVGAVVLLQRRGPAASEVVAHAGLDSSTARQGASPDR